MVVAVVAWWLAVLVGLAFVAYGFGPLFHQRAQRVVQRQARAAIEVAANEATGLGGVTVARHAPDLGAAVAMLEVGSLKLQQGVVEGVGTSETRRAPGHVPGTAGLGQPGNAVVVGRAEAFGSSFGSIGKLLKNDRIVVTTTQGQSVYVVFSVKRASLDGSIDDPRSVLGGAYGPSADDRLTLITSASRNPFNDSRAIVVVATMDGTPFHATPQAALSGTRLGTTGDRGAIASVILAFVAYVGVMAGGVVVYRRLRSRTAYVLTIAPVLALTIVAAETFSRLLPAWF
jgi:sortase A